MRSRYFVGLQAIIRENASLAFSISSYKRNDSLSLSMCASATDT